MFIETLAAMGAAALNIPVVHAQKNPLAATEQQFLTFGNWSAMNPTNYNPNTGTYASISSIEADLDILVAAGITGIRTYGANNGLREIPRLAKDRGLSVIMGIWDIDRDGTGSEEWTNAVNAASHVDGYAAGNEGLYIRYTFYELTDYINALRAETGKPVTTSEVLPRYSEQWVLDTGDWLFPNIHPFWSDAAAAIRVVRASITDPQQAYSWTRARHDEIVARANGKLVILGECGLPTEGASGLSEEGQRDYYALMNTSGMHFHYFEAFDQLWKNWHPVEPHWGLWDASRNPKLAAGIIGDIPTGILLR